MYAEVALAAQDQDLRARIAGCLAMLGHTTPHPMSAAEGIQWEVVSVPAVAAAYNYAVQLNQIARPGQDPSVISDEAILSAVSTVLEIGE